MYGDSTSLVVDHRYLFTTSGAHAFWTNQLQASQSTNIFTISTTTNTTQHNTIRSDFTNANQRTSTLLQKRQAFTHFNLSMTAFSWSANIVSVSEQFSCPLQRTPGFFCRLSIHSSREIYLDSVYSEMPSNELDARIVFVATRLNVQEAYSMDHTQRHA